MPRPGGACRLRCLRAPSTTPDRARRRPSMTLRLKINLIVAALTILFVCAVLALQLRSMRDSVHEEVVAANRVATQLLQRTAWLYAAQGTAAIVSAGHRAGALE